MKTTVLKQAILEQKYKVAAELRQLAALQYGRGSAQFVKADGKCQAALAKLESSKVTET